MGHVHSDRVEEAWRDLSKAGELATNGQEFGATNQVRLIFRHVAPTAREVGDIGGELDILEDRIREKLVQIERDGYEIRANDVLDVLADVAEYLELLADKVHAWFESELPDYKYGLKLNQQLSGIQKIQSVKNS